MIGKPATKTDSRRDENEDEAADTAHEALDARYRVERELARGGRGRVWLAHDTEMQRTVVIKQSARRGTVSDARFVREAHVTARLQHPAIVPVYDAGTATDGAPFYTMKLIEGRTLQEVIEAATTRTERIALLSHVITIADAIAYAHDRGVIHRDLKPSNVVCGAFGETVVVDWGLAKVAGEPDIRDASSDGGGALLTREGSVVGTPAYMAPEQARGERVDEHADIYAIGAILYHAIGGAAPYAGASADAVIAAAIAGPPARLTAAPADLVAIVERAMAREPAHRYASARELADDLRRFVAGRLVHVYDYSPLARIARWAARHRMLVGLAAVALVAIAIISVVAVDRVIAERDGARRAELAAAERADALVLVQARELVERDPAAALAWLKQYRDAGTDWTRVRALALDAASRRPARHIWRHRAGIGAIATSPSGAYVASGGADGVQLWDAASGRRTAAIDVATRVTELAFTADEHTLVAIDIGGLVHVHDLATHTTRAHAPGLGPLFVLALARDDVAIVVGGTFGFAVVDRTRGVTRVQRSDARITSIVLLPQRLAIGDANGGVQLWEDGVLHALGRQDGDVNDLALAGDAIISTGNDKALHAFSLHDGAPTRLPLDAVCGDLAVAPAGARIALACRDGRVRIVDANTIVETLALPGGAGEVVEVAWSPDGQRIAAGVLDGRVVEWDIATGFARVLALHQPGLVRVAFARGGELVGSGRDGVARLWPAESETGARIIRPSTVLLLAAALTGKVALAEQHGEIAILDGGVRTIHRGDPAHALEISPTGDRVWAATWDGRVRRWDGDRVSVLDASDGMTWALAVRGERFVAAGASGLRVWDGDSPPRRLVGHDGASRAVALLPDGRVLSGGSDGTLRLWADPQSHRVLVREPSEIYFVAVTNDGAHAASLSARHIRLWRTADWSSQQLALGGRTRAVAFSPDGAWLAAATAGGAIALWDLRTGARRDLAGPEAGSNRLAFAPDSKHFATSGADGLVRVWSVATGSDRVAHRFDAESFDVAWTGPTTIVASSADRTVWSGPGVGPFVAPDRSSIRALLATTTAAIDAGGLATTTAP